MAYPVYSTNFLVGNLGFVLVQFVVPAGYRAVVRDVAADWLGDPVNGELTHFSAGGPNIIRWVGPANVPQSYHWTGRQVYNEGETIFAEAVVGNWGVRTSGYLLTLP